MIDALLPIKGWLKVNPIIIDNCVFKLHYNLTAWMFVACAIFHSLRSVLASPIHCIGPSPIPSDALNSYCYITSTYTIPGKVGPHVAHPGVALGEKDDKIVYHNYYQWVNLILLVQGLLFRLPYNVWKIWEHNLMKMLSENLGSTMIDDELKNRRKSQVVNYFNRNQHCRHNCYLLRFFFCELLNFLNVAAQIWITDRVLDYAFTTYGLEMLSITEKDSKDRSDPMSKYFPKMTKCTFNIYGPSGSIINYDTTCVLPLNVYNEKIYIFQWIWYSILSTVSGLQLFYRLFTFSITPMRDLLLSFRAPLCNREDVKLIVSRHSAGDWFVLYQLSKNIDTALFHDIIKELANNHKPDVRNSKVNNSSAGATCLGGGGDGEVGDDTKDDLITNKHCEYAV